MIGPKKQNAIHNFVIIDDDTTDHHDACIGNHCALNTLVAVSSTSKQDVKITRYQQYYKGIVVEGRSVVKKYMTSSKKKKEPTWSGQLTTDISLDIDLAYLSEQYRDTMVQIAVSDYKKKPGKQHAATPTLSGIEKSAPNKAWNDNTSPRGGRLYDQNSQPLIWVDDDEVTLVYSIDFKISQANITSQHPYYLIDAETKEIVKQWDNIQFFDLQEGFAGNIKTGMYTYGRDGLPALPTWRIDNTCFLASAYVRVVNAYNTWQINNSSNPTPVSHVCGQNNGDISNGAWSPANDAFSFGNLISEMYLNWYGYPVLQNQDGTVKQLIVVVHVGNNYTNAQWNGQYLLFGDGGASYHPFTSLGIMAHEMGHVFTGAHSSLLYMDQSGAINESFSDMLLIAAEYYMQQRYPQGYMKIYGKNSLDWLVGDRIAKGNYAIRSLATPQYYGSADCEENGSGCSRTWDDIVERARQLAPDKRQNYIVHNGSGILNRAFYKMVNEFNGDVKKVFEMFFWANMTSWTSRSDFGAAACGVKEVARALNYDVDKVHRSFRAVQITPDC